MPVEMIKGAFYAGAATMLRMGSEDRESWLEGIVDELNAYGATTH